MFEGLGNWAAEAMLAGGSVALTLLMLAENLFPPIPSEIVLPYAGFLVGQGRLGWVTALFASTLGSTLGALVLYALGRWGGLPLLLRFRHVLRLSQSDIEQADGWFDRHGPKIVFFGRMVPLVRSIVSVPAGTSEMPIWEFLAFTAVGSALWNLLLIGAGVALGDNWRQVGAFIGTYANLVLAVLVVATAAVIVWWWRRRVTRQASA